MKDKAALLQQAKKAFESKEYEEAQLLLHELVAIDSFQGEVHHILGLVAAAQGDLFKATACMEKAIEECQSDPKIYYNYGTLLQMTARYPQAMDQYEKAIALDSDYREAHNNYATVMTLFGKLSDAEKHIRKILALDHSHIEAYTNLGNVLKDGGKIPEALECYLKALEIKPDYLIARSNYLLGLCYLEQNQEFVFQEHRKWEENIPAELRDARIKPNARDSSHQRCLKIGYISPDFKTHSVAFFMEQILKHHDRAAFEIFCYSDVVKPDPITMRFKSMPVCWRDIYNKNNPDTASLIAGDGIDLLVDLAGHAGNARLPVLYMKPAPVQITYLGYPNTTGLSTVDFRLTDRIADPPGQDAFYTEHLYRMPGCFLCYQPPQVAPDATALPALKNGHITFGSFNNLPKISPETIALWASILRAVKGSKLFVKTKPFIDEAVRNRFVQLFSHHGIGQDRLILQGHSQSIESHLGCYSQVDIALDTSPYNGTTTTCEALWMGVPVITLAGTHHASRVGASLLTQVNLTGLIAQNSDSYVNLAKFLAGDDSRLSKLRTGLRPMMAQSPLCDGREFIQKLERAYRDIWQKVSAAV